MNFFIETISPQPVLGIRTQTTLAQIGDDIGRVMPELAGHAGDRMAGPPLARWHQWDGSSGEMEVAVPVKALAAGGGNIEASELPGGRAAVAIHVGPYEGLKVTWEALKGWMTEQGLEGAAAPWEQYVSDPGTTPAAELQTRIVWPLK